MKRASPGIFAGALRAYTSSAAFAGRIEHVTGSVEPSKQADLAILSGDPDEQEDVSVEEVYVAGRKRWPLGLGSSQADTAQ